ANEVVVAFGDDGLIVYVSPACERLLGFAPSSAVGTNFADYLHPEDAERAIYMVDQVDRHPAGMSYGSYRLRHDNGSWVPVDVSAGFAHGDGNRYFVALCRFSTAPQTERLVLLGLLGGAPMAQVMAPVLDSIAWYDLGSHVAIAWADNDGWHHVDTGLPPLLSGDADREPWAGVVASGRGVLCDGLDALPDAVREVARDNGLGGYWIEPVPGATIGGTSLVTIWTGEGRSSPRIHEFGMTTATSYVDLIGQFTTQRRLLAHAASHDPLTGLANRKMLDEAVVRGGGGAVLYCDLDRFKPVNDRFGHAVGDELLSLVAQRLTRCVRAEDVVARIGGDEFVILCPDLDPAATEQLANRILDAFGSPFELDGGIVEVGASIGIVNVDAFDAATITRADRAMYEAKAAGHGTYRRAAPAPS
ncbi:MAG: GGDEF domain-containing protein, partial [Actinobacteria bacterium]|nr:GGDEF domain-containing protein [Actinomycetota bacterium]